MPEKSTDNGWSESLPRGFYPLMKTPTYKFGSVDCLAVVAGDIQCPKRAIKGNDYFTTVKLKDPSLFTPFASFQDRDYLKCRWFQRSVEELPRIQNPGDIVLVRRADVTVSNRDRTSEVVLSCKSTNQDTIVFPVGSVNTPQYGPTTQPPTPAEQLLATRLAEWVKENLGILELPSDGLPPVVTKAPRPQADSTAKSTPVSKFLRPVHKKFSLLEKVADRFYYVIFGEVVKIFTREGQYTEIYVTDYTTNNLFFDYKDNGSDGNGAWDPESRNENNKGECPKGRMTLQITLWPPHCDFANHNVKRGDIVRLNNMHVKYKDIYLEGSLHGDNRYPDKIDISVISEKDSTFGELPGLLARRDKYRAALQAPPVNESKTAKKRRVKKEKEKKAEEEKRRLVRENNQILPARSNDTSLSNKPVENSNGLNGKIVAAANKSLQPLTLHSIIYSPHLRTTLPNGTETTLPFINMTALAHVRVVGFKPDKLEDFAHCLDSTEYADVSEADDEEPMDLDASPENRWEWAFWLLLEDARPVPGEEPATRLPVLVHGKDADYLLKLDAANLRREVATLHQLKQKLRVLWGDVEDIKSEGAMRAPDTMGFECCIQEYGVQQGDDGWLRMHRLCKTTIQ